MLAMMQDLGPQESLRKETRRAITDELTAVRNRRGFLEGAQMVIEFARRQRQIHLPFIVIAGDFPALIVID